MALFDFLKFPKNKNSIFNNIGEFSYIEFDGTKNYKGIIISSINENIE
jgi:hypothetical protein